HRHRLRAGGLYGGHLRGPREPRAAHAHGVQPGGQLMLTTLVENYPGFVEGIQGPELMETMKRQAEHFGTEMIAEDVTAVDFSRRPFVVQAGDATWEGHTIIIATGATARLLGLPAETKILRCGISTSVTSA